MYYDNTIESYTCPIWHFYSNMHISFLVIHTEIHIIHYTYPIRFMYKIMGQVVIMKSAHEPNYKKKSVIFQTMKMIR